MNIDLHYPYTLILLMIIPCFVYCVKKSTTCYLPKLSWIPKKNRFININLLLKISIFSLFTLALTSPFSYDSISPSNRFGKDIVLALDSSGSMNESGFDKSDKSKFELLQEILMDFIDQRVNDNIGVVIFGTFAFSASPITYDKSSLKELLWMVDVGIAGDNTAIGEGISQSIRTLKFGSAKEKIIILVSDGFSNAGSISIEKALQQAKEKSIKIYTIGLGKKENFDEPLMQKIADESNGKSFGVNSTNELREVYEKINILENSPIRSEQYLNKKDLFIFPLLLATILLIWLLYRRRII